MSAVALAAECGPPAFLSFVSWYGLSHAPVRGFGLHTVGMPWRIGMPLAPGYVPKYVSKERFSCMITITCLILWMPLSAASALSGVRLYGLLAWVAVYPARPARAMENAASSPATALIAFLPHE